MILVLLAAFFSQNSFAQLDFNKLKNVKIEVKNGKTTIKNNDAATQSAPAPTPAAAPAAPSGPSPACNAIRTVGLCYAFTGAEGSDEKKSKGNQMACKFMKGTWMKTGMCPNTAAYGNCTVLQGQPGEYVLYYYAGKKMKKEEAQTDCANAKSSIHRHGAGVWTTL